MMWRMVLFYGIVSALLTFGVIGFTVGTLFYIPIEEEGYLGIMTIFNPFFSMRLQTDTGMTIFMLYPIAILAIAYYKMRQLKMKMEDIVSV